MKRILPIILAAVVLTGCFGPYKKHESLLEKRTFHQNGKLASEEIRRDTSKGGAPALFVDPKVAQIASENVNQTALGGGSKLKVGEVTGTNRPDAMKAAGGAGGELIGAASGRPSGLTLSEVLTVSGNSSDKVPGEQVVRISDKIYKREPDIYGLDGKLFRFDGEKRTMTPLP